MAVVTASNQRPRVNFGWIGESFDIFKRDASVWVGAIVTAFFLRLILVAIFDGYSYSLLFPALLNHTAAPDIPPWINAMQILGGLLGFAVDCYFAAGLFGMANKAVRGEPIGFADLFSGSNRILSFVLYFLAYGLGNIAFCVICFICFPVGFFFSFAFFLPGFALLADGEEIGSAVSKSFDAMKNDFWNGAAFAFCFAIVWLLGTIPLFLGLIVVGPMYYIVSALAYRDMIGWRTEPDFVTPGGSWPPEPGVWPPPPSVTTPNTPVAPASTTLTPEASSDSVEATGREEHPVEDSPPDTDASESSIGIS